MTLIEYITSLQDTGLSRDEIIAKTKEFKKTIGLEDTKVTETPVEEVKTEVVVEKDAAAATTPVASESSSSGSGEPTFTSMYDEDATASQGLDIINQRALRLKAEKDFDADVGGVKTKAILSKLPLGSKQRADYYISRGFEADDTISKSYYDRASGYVAPNSFLIDEGEVEGEFSLSAPKTEIPSESQELKGSDQIIDIKGPSDTLGLDEPKKQVPDTFFEDLTKEFESEKESGIGTTEGFIDGFILENDLDLEYENLYFNKEKSTKFVDDFYGGADALKEFGVNAVDFEGFLNRNGHADDYLNNLKEGEYEDTSIYGKDNKLAEERHLRKYLNLYVNRQDYKANQLNKLEKIKKDPKFKTSTFGNARNNVLNAISKVEESNIYLTTVDQQKQKDYLKSKFTLSTAKDKEYAKAKIDYAKELDQRGDWYAAAANTGSFLAEGGEGFLTGMRDLVNFGLDITGFDLAVDKDRNYQAEEQLAKDSSYFTSITDAKTITRDGIEYAKDSKGNIYNVSAGYNVSGVITGLQLEGLDKEIESKGVKKNHTSLRGYLTVGGNVTGNVISQVVGQKGFGAVTRAAKLRTLASVNGFKSVKNYKNMVNLSKAIGGKAKPSFRIPVKKSTVDAMLFQGSYGGAIGYNNTLAQAKAAGFNDADAEALAYDAGQYMAVWYAATGPISDRTTWLDKVGGNLGVQKIVSNALSKTRKGSVKNFSQSLKNQLTNLSYKLKSKGYDFAKEGGKETLQENLQQSGEFLWINPKLNTKAKVDFLQDTYSDDEIISTSVLSFATGGLLSQIKVPSFKPNANAQIANYTYIAKNSAKAELELDRLVSSGFATQEEADQIMFNSKAILNQSPKIPKWLNGDYVLNVAQLMQQKQDLENQKKSTAPSFHGPLDDDIENLDLEIDALVRQSADEKRTQLQKGVSAFVDAVAKASDKEVDIQNFETTSEANAYRQELEDKGVSVFQSQGYGDFVLDDKTGDITVIIDDQVNTEDNVVTTEVHEGGHLLVSATVKKDPKAAAKLGSSLLQELADNSNIEIKNDKVAKRIAQYIADGDSTAVVMEEVMMFTSEALIDGDIVFNETASTKIGDLIRRTLQNVFGIKVKFKDGKSVINFLRDYNKTIESGKASKGLVRTAIEGSKVTIKDSDIDAAKKIGRTEVVVNEETGVAEDIEVKPVVEKESSKASKRVYQEVESMKLDLLDPKKKKDATIMAAYSLVDEAKRRMRNINLSEDVIDDIARTFALDEKRGLVGLIDKWTPDRNDSVMGYLNSKSASGRSLFDARLQEFYEADPRYNEIIQSESQEGVTEKMQRQTATEQDVEVPTKPVTRKIKPSSFISDEAVTKIKEQVQEKIKGIDPKNLTFKKLGDLAPEIIAAEIGIPVKKLTSPTANLSKGDATAIQQFVNKNADKLLKILPEGAVVEAATEKLLGTSTGVPKGLLNAFYTKQARLGKGAGLAPFKLNKGISKADFLEVFGIVEGKKAEGFDARSPQAQALKGIASLYGKLVTNEIVRSDTDLSLEVKQDVAAGKSKAMASKRLLAAANIKPGLVDEFLKATSSKGFNDILETKLKDESIKQPWKSAATEYFKENPIEGLDLKARRQVISEISSIFSMKNEEVAVKRFSDKSFKELKNIIDESLASDLSKGYTFDTVDLIVGDKTYRADERSLEGLNRIRVGVKILVDALAAKGFNKQQIETALYGGFITPANIGGFRVGKEPTSILLTAENLGEKTKTSRGSMAVNINDFRNNFLKGIPDGEKIKTKKETYSKDYWTNPKSKFNKLDQAGKLEFIQDLFNEGSKVKLELADLVETISELDVAPEVTRYMITQLFADMSALGKRASGTRYVLTGVDGKMFSFKELEKLGLTRPDGDKGVFEHTKPANRVAVAAYAYARTGDAKAKQEFLNELETFDSALITEQMDDMLRNLKLQSKMGIDYKSTDNPMVTRYREMVSDLSEQGVFFYDIKTKKQITPLEALSDGLVELEADDIQSIKEYKKEVKVKSELVPGKVMASKRDGDLIPDAIKYDRPISVKTAINALEKTDKSLELARKLDQPVKKIRVFDFDDTLARTKSNVLYTMPDGTTGAIDAATFAKEAGNMEAEGAQWDFSEFSKVMQGSKGPLLDVAKIIADKRGTKDVFVLTARPANAAGPIKEFLASMGLDIPLANITGLGDGTPQAKAGWIMGKAAEGYNDFYFADDHTGNVKAVKDVLSQIDVKSKVQLAKASKRQTFDTVVNDMIEDSSGIETYKKYSAARAKTVGASKGKYNFLIPPSAEDFTGLLYKMIGKGKKGDAQMAFLKTNLLDTYNRAESAVTQAKVSAANDFVALKTKLKTLPKTLSKETGIGKFTYSHAVRVAAWTKQGMDIPGLSKRDIKELNDFVNKDAKLRVFTDELIKIQKGKEYPKPGKDWLGGNITTDIIGGINKVNRAEYQQEWRENIDIIFSEDNMNKMEAAYGSRWREAMEDSIRRMKSGSNRPIGGNRVTEGLLNWLNNSVGAVMFLNTRSALLQTISAVNFINLSDNNIVKAGVAFANQKQFWGDFMTLMNSDYLVERRNGLKINVSESEIADAVRESQNKPKAAIAFLLSKGFVMTRFADSFAIASGGSTFYRNRVNKYVKEGIEQSVAEKQAFADFKAIAEESQQSSSPSKISQQQASAAGRVILAWANTPMQYARIQKRAAQDLINGRGDWKSNVSKIVYYGAIQNLIFNSLQSAAFALGFGDDEEETDEAKSKKKEEKAYKDS